MARELHDIGNGFKVSVVDCWSGYNRFEVAVLYKGKIVPTPLITDDNVMNGLTRMDVTNFINKARAYVLLGIDPNTGNIVE